MAVTDSPSLSKCFSSAGVSHPYAAPPLSWSMGGIAEMAEPVLTSCAQRASRRSGSPKVQFSPGVLVQFAPVPTRSSFFSTTRNR